MEKTMKPKIWGIAGALVLLMGCTQRPIRMAPQARMDEKKVRVFPHVILIESSDELIWGKVLDSRSMIPVFDMGHHTIEIKNPQPERLKVGDIISYWRYNLRIIHRIVEIGRDDKGWFAIAQGDNQAESDLEKIRPEQIIGVVIAIVF